MPLTKRCLILVSTICFLFAATACRRQKSWDGEFTGSVIERLEEQDDLQQTKGKPENKTMQNYKLSFSKKGESETVLTFGDCHLQIDIYPNDEGYVRTGQSCHVSINGHEDDFVLNGTLFKVQNSLRFTLIGQKKESFKRTVYTFNFSGQMTK